MRDQHAAVQALAARGLGLRAIARELGVDRKTARRFAHATTGDQAVARAISRPTVLDRYQPHLHRRWNEGCHDTAVLHAEITALGYRGSLRTVYRYLQPLRSGTAPAALTPSALKIGEVTSWLLRRAEDLNPRQQQLLADVRGHCAQLDRLAEHVTGFAKMMTKRTGEQHLAGWLERVDADDQPELHTFAAGIRQDLAAVTAGLSLPYSSGPTEGNVNRLKAIKTTDVRPRQPRPAAQTRHPSPTVTPITEFAPEPITLASDTSRRAAVEVHRSRQPGNPGCTVEQVDHAE